jgi:hypothetical protein
MTQLDTAVSDVAEISICSTPRDGLLSVVRLLDSLPAHAVTVAQVAHGPEVLPDPFCGLHIDQYHVVWLLAREPCEPILHLNSLGEPQETGPISNHDDTRLSCIERAFDLPTFSIDLILIALAPELGLRYERLYAYLQDDVRKKRSIIDLALNLLCPPAADKLAQQAHFSPDTSRVRHGLLHLLPDPHQVQSPLSVHSLKLNRETSRPFKCPLNGS